MARVVGIQSDSEPAAIRLEALAEVGVVAVTVEGRAVVVWHQPGTASALDESRIDAGDDVGATGAFVAEIDGRSLSFRRHGDGFIDDETGSRWDIFGRATGGPLGGRRLEPVDHVDTFWFAWAAFRPDTTIVP